MRPDVREQKLQHMIDEAQAIVDDGGILSMTNLAAHLGVSKATLYRSYYKNDLFARFPQLEKNKSMTKDEQIESLNHKLEASEKKVKYYRLAFAKAKEECEREKVKADKFKKMYHEALIKYQELAESKIIQF